MKKQFVLENLDCAHCAQKIEDAVRKLPEVDDVQVNFLKQTLTLTAADEDFDRTVKLVAKTCRRVEPDCRMKV